MLDSVTCSKMQITEGVEGRALDALLDALEEQLYLPGEIVAAEGDFDVFLGVIKSGEAAVRREGIAKSLALLHRNDCFGEVALVPSTVEGFKRAKRKTSVVAAGDGPLVVLQLRPEHIAGGNLSSWRRALAEEVVRHATHGIDYVTVEQSHKQGRDVNQMISNAGKQHAMAPGARGGARNGSSKRVAGK